MNFYETNRQNRVKRKIDFVAVNGPKGKAMLKIGDVRKDARVRSIN